jgi:hypothetical protein
VIRAGRAACAVAVVGVGIWAVRDYRAWRALGEGGLPPTPLGWLTTTALRLATRDRFLVRPQSTQDGHRLAGLPMRRGARPPVARYPVPHRVLGPPPADDVLLALRRLLDELAGSPGLEYRTSHWERHHQALWRTGPDREIAHLHPVDGSLHVVLGPADAQHAIDRGWGELHPLAGVPRLGLPGTYTLLYPPRGAEDIAAIRLLLTNAVEHA